MNFLPHRNLNSLNVRVSFLRWANCSFFPSFCHSMFSDHYFHTAPKKKETVSQHANDRRAQHQHQQQQQHFVWQEILRLCILATNVLRGFKMHSIIGRREKKRGFLSFHSYWIDCHLFFRLLDRSAIDSARNLYVCASPGRSLLNFVA